MESSNEEKTLIRRYLLGETTELETEGIEKKMIIDDEYFKQVISEKEELVEQYAQGDMPGELQERFERSFLLTPEGREQVQITKELYNYAPTDRARRPSGNADALKMPSWSTIFQRPYAIITALILVFILPVFGIYRVFFYRSDADRGLAELKRVYRDRRPTEARLAEFDYAPWLASRGGDNKEETAYAERMLRDAVHDNPSAESYYALGVFYLTEQDFDKAVAQFELSASYAPPDARLHTALGTALLERGRASSSATKSRAVVDFSESFSHLQKALEMEPARLDALFNLALLYEAQGMAERAKEAWEAYLEKDPDSKWADEARERLLRLDESRRISLLSKEELLNEFIKAFDGGEADRAWMLLSRSREPLSGKSVTEQLLDLYIDNSLKGGNAGEKPVLDALAFAGELEIRRAGDRYSQTLAKFYKGRSPNDLQMLKQARDLTKQGHAHFEDDQYDRAIEAHTRAREIFNKLGDRAESASSSYRIAYCYSDRFDSKTALPLFKELMPYCDANQFRWFSMRCLAGMAGSFYVQGKYSEAAKHYRASLEAAEEIDDPAGELYSLDGLTEVYRFIGNYPRSFECIQRGFKHTLTTPMNPLQRLRYYSIIASVLTSAGLWEAALEYQKEGLRGDVTSAPANAAVAYAHLGAYYAKQKKYNEAKETIDLAFETARRMSSEKTRDTYVAYSSLYLGHIYREMQEYDRAIATYTETIESFGRLNIPLILYQAHKGRLYCYIAKNDDMLIQEELETTLRMLEGDRSNILGADDRNNFFDREQSVYDIAIGYTYFTLHDSDKAFEYSEASRGRSLLDMMNGATIPSDEQPARDISFREVSVSSPLKLREIKDRLPDSVQVVQYSVLDRRTLVWVISKNDPSKGTVAVPVEVGREELEADVKNYVGLISQPPGADLEDPKHLSGELFNILIKPVLSSLDKSKSIFIVPDKVLSYLPFESLISPDTGSYLLEDYNIAYTPSSSVFIACSEEALTRDSSGKVHILSVGNPAFDRKAFPTLDVLRSARSEAEKIAELYDTKVLLVEDGAKEQRVKSEIDKADVVHIAAHAILDEYSPLQSKLILAKGIGHPGSEASEDGVLEAEELYRLKLPRTQLAVLSSCHSGVDHYYDGEGMLSLARPFTASRVPLVVASLWAVDSESTADLMIDFHGNRRCKRKPPSIAALREAKLKMLEQGSGRYRHPYFWAPFVAIGGYTKY